jgi:hypothetical protein
VVGFNHENFDMKKMRGQFALLGIDYPKPPTNIDIYKTVRQMGFPSSKLDYIAPSVRDWPQGEASRLRDVERLPERLCPKAQKMARLLRGRRGLPRTVYTRLPRGSSVSRHRLGLFVQSLRIEEPDEPRREEN